MSEGVMLLLIIAVSMIYFCWVMSPKELILDLEIHKQNNIQIQKQIFILSGQSNMLGLGGVNKTTLYNGVEIKVWDGVVPPESRPNPAVYRFNEHFKWELAHEPLHYGINCKLTCGIGLGMAFANKLLEMDPNFGVIGLMPGAAGGTSIANWSGDYSDNPYKVLVHRTKAALKEGGNLRGIIWYQGEADSMHPYNSKRYKMWFEKFIQRLRSDLQFPTLPFFQIILPRIKKPYVDEVRKAQQEFTFPNLIKVEANGLPLSEDGVHLTTKGYIQLGFMLADAFLKTNSILLKNKTVISTYNTSSCM